MTGVAEGLADDPDRVGEVDDPGTGRRAALDRGGQLEDDRDRPERLGEAAGPDRLLADEPELGRQRLVAETRLLTADAELDEDDIGAIDRGVPISRLEHPARPALTGEHALRQTAHDREPLRVDVEEGDLVDLDAVGSPGEAVDELWRVRAAASDDRQLEAHLTSPVPASRTGM